MVRSLWLTLSLSLLISSSAESQSVREFLNYCSTGSIRTCASTRVETIWDPVMGVTRVNLMIRNLQGWLFADNSAGSAITRVALTAPTLVNPRGLAVTTVGDAAAVGSPQNYWQIRDWPLEGNTEFLAMTSTGTNPGPVEGGIMGCHLLTMVTPANFFRTCGSGGWINFAFLTTGMWDASTTEIAWAVIKTNADGTNHLCRSDDPLTCNVPPVTTTPEPASIFLLGSGLAGLAAMKRKRQARLEHAGQENLV